MSRCPKCGHHATAGHGGHGGDAIWTVERLRRACEAASDPVLLGDRVREDVAAKILDRSPGTLRNWRAQARPIPYHAVNGRAFYLLADLAQFLNNARED